MSFTFNWPRFSDQFHYDAIQMLNNALNKGNKPPVIADKIEVVELEMGTEPPELEIREIGELTVDQFRGIFRLSYSGDAHLVLKTKVQANPLNHKQPDIHLMTGSKGMLAARQPLVVPMLLRLSHFNLRSIIVLVVSKQKGITLVFKTDPLQHVDISSTFDSIGVIQKFIQREIEGQLRQMFREDLPGIIHRLSQQWIKAKVEAPYMSQRQFTASVANPTSELTFQNVNKVPESLHSIRPGPASRSHMSEPSLHSSKPPSVLHRSYQSPPGTSQTTHEPPDPDDDSELANFDPTYGLRPEGLPTKSVFKGLSNLFTTNRGLADLAEEEELLLEDDGDEVVSYDMVDWDGGLPTSTPPTTIFNYTERLNSEEMETIPAVGGGFVSRPRIYHSQSRVQSADGRQVNKPARPRPTSSLSLDSTSTYSPLNASSLQRSNSYFSDHSPYSLDTPSTQSHTAPTFFTTHARPPTPDSMEAQPANADDLQDSPRESSHTTGRSRRLSTSSSPSTTYSGSMLDSNPKIILQPSAFNNTLHHLSTLSHSNHTLSPYTRSLQHFTVRSVPPRCLGGPLGSSAQGAERQPVKAKRKRTYRLGGSKHVAPPTPSPLNTDTYTNPSSPALPSPISIPYSPSDADFDLSDMDRYFRSYDNTRATIHPSHVRLRQSYAHPE